MNKETAIKKLEQKIKEIKILSDDVQIVCDTERIHELAKCPRCGTYLGQGYSIDKNYQCTFYKCVCGYKGSDPH